MQQIKLPNASMHRNGNERNDSMFESFLIRKTGAMLVWRMEEIRVSRICLNSIWKIYGNF